MADNVPVTPGTGVEIATDQRPDNSHVQWNKIMVGGDGAFVPVTTNEPFPVAQAAPSAFDDGNKAVASAGTSVPLVAASTPCREVTVTAADTNVGAVVVGGANVVAAAATRRGTPLWPRDSATISIDDLSKVHIDAESSGDKVTFDYVA